MSLIKNISLLLILSFSFITSALSAPASVKWNYRSVNYYEPATLCQAYIQYTQTTSTTITYTLISSTLQSTFVARCTYSLKSGNDTSSTYSQFTGEYYCPYPPMNTSTNPPTCGEPPPACEKGCNGACGTYYKLGAGLPSTSCIGTCIYKILDGIQGTAGGWIGLVGDNQGQTCTPPTPAPTDASNTPEYNCASKGQSYGTVNGAVVCVDKGTVGAAPTAEVKEQPKITTTPAPTPENPNPAPVTSQPPPVVVVTTPPPAGSPAGTEPKVSSSTTNPDGSTTNKDESKESFCKDNPTSKLCKAETQCQENPEGPTCKHFCDKFPDSMACKDPTEFLEEAIGKPEDIPTEDELEEKEIESPLNFNRVSVPTANGCPPPLTMSLYGAPIVMSFQWLCDYASAFKPLMIAFALMFAATVVMGGVRSDAQPFQRGLF